VIAAADPAGPPPMTKMSHCITVSLPANTHISYLVYMGHIST